MLQIGFKRRLGDDYYKQLFTTLLDAIPSSVLLINPEMRIVSANRNFLNKSRRTELNTHGFRLEEVFPPGILDHLNIAQRIIDVFKSGSPTLGAFMTYRTPGLPMRFYYYKVIPFCYGKEVEQALLLMDDVTDKVRLSARCAVFNTTWPAWWRAPATSCYPPTPPGAFLPGTALLSACPFIP